MKNVGHTRSKFDLDLEYGTEGENKVLSILNGAKKVEVKSDKIAYFSRRIAVEYEFSGKPSGIATTEADYWAFLIEQTGTVIFIPTDKLKQLCRHCYKLGYILEGGDYNASKMVYVPITMLVKEKSKP